MQSSGHAAAPIKTRPPLPPPPSPRVTSTAASNQLNQASEAGSLTQAHALATVNATAGQVREEADDVDQRKRPPSVSTPTTLLMSSASASTKTTTTTTMTPGSSSSGSQQAFRSGGGPIPSGRRHALQGQSLERDAVLSLKVRELKHKRTTSIKSALRNAHFGSLKLSFDRRHHNSNSNNKHSHNDNHHQQQHLLVQQPSSQQQQANTTTRTSSGNGNDNSSNGPISSRNDNENNNLGPMASSSSSSSSCAHSGLLRNDSTANSSMGHSGAGSSHHYNHHHHHHHHHATTIGSCSQPYELFEPPITQRSVQRSKRRGAMMSNDPRRQMSADTIGLRQLTDEYLTNAGVIVKPMSSSGQCSLVALTGPPPLAMCQATSAAASAASPAGAGSAGVYGTQPQYSLLEAQLYQVSRQAALAASSTRSATGGSHHGAFKTAISMIESSSRTRSGSDDSMKTPGVCGLGSKRLQAASNAIGLGAVSNENNPDNNICTILPGQLPWQADVSIQCELLAAPPLVEPYETTGDILSAIARPYASGPSRSPSRSLRLGQTESLDTGGGSGGGHLHLSATLRKGLTAISQHHLAPAGLSAQEAALNVVGSLKKSLSNTLDVAGRNHTPACLCSQDSLPAYSSLKNEDEEEEHHLDNGQDQSLRDCKSTQPAGVERLENSQPEQQEQETNQLNLNPNQLAASNATTSLMGRVAKLSRQSSKKLMVSTAAAVGKKVGLQRALSLDCRGGIKNAPEIARSATNSQDNNSQADTASSGSGSSGKLLNATNCINITNQHHTTVTGNVSQHHKSSQSIATTPKQQHLGDQNHNSRLNHLPQSASQVDFQVPLLPYDRMQEAIVSSRLLDPRKQGSSSASGSISTLAALDQQATANLKQQQQQQLNNNNHQSAYPNNNPNGPPLSPRSLVANTNLADETNIVTSVERDNNKKDEPPSDRLLCAAQGFSGDQTSRQSSSSLCYINEQTNHTIGSGDPILRPGTNNKDPLKLILVDHDESHRLTKQQANELSATTRVNALVRDEHLASKSRTITTRIQDNNFKCVTAAVTPISRMPIESLSKETRLGDQDDDDNESLRPESGQMARGSSGQNVEQNTIRTTRLTRQHVADQLAPANKQHKQIDITIEEPTTRASSLSASYYSNQQQQTHPSSGNNTFLQLQSQSQSQQGQLESQQQIIPNSPSFSISADGKTSSLGGGSSQLTANEIFSGSNQLTKRPSTMLVGDAMSQFAQALSSTSANSGGATNPSNQHQGPAGSSFGATCNQRNRRQAIVPPKLSTDPPDGTSSSDEYGTSSCSQPKHPAARLAELNGETTTSNYCARNSNHYQQENIIITSAPDPNQNHQGLRCSDPQRRASADELSYAYNARRKRSGGDPIGKREKHYDQQGLASGQRAEVPSVVINNDQEPEHDDHERGLQSRASQQTICSSSNNNHQRFQSGATTDHTSGGFRANSALGRPDSQMTNPDSFCSSASSLCKRDLNSPGALTVAFDSFRDRRRSSIAIIPQMQICPGDLLVYSKQLIERMNQTDESSETPEFLTIDDKKGKNIWSSFKLFDNRSIKARHEYLCNLDEVLNALQPSTFVDEQLSHYKGMLWNEFLIETECRRSASSEALALIHLDDEIKHQASPRTDETLKLLSDSRLSDTENGGARLSDEDTTMTNPVSPTAPTTGVLNESRRASGRETPTTNSPARESNSRSGSIKIGGWSIRGPRGSMKGNQSAANSHQQQTATNSNDPNSSQHTQSNHQNSARQSGAPAPSSGVAGIPQSPLKPSRFKEKPKLRRGQTVDSVFRIPLVPSSPLKHAQIHQQTPTAHLDHQELITIEDEFERTSPPNNRANDDITEEQQEGSKEISGELEEEGNSNSMIDHHHQKRLSATLKGKPPHTRSYRTSVQGVGADASHGASNTTTGSSFELDCSEQLELTANSGRSSSGFQAPRFGATHHPPNHHQRRQIMRQSSLSTLSSTITRTEQKRQRALWDLFQSECTFFFDHLMTLKNVYMEPLKKIQVEGFAMQADPDVLFGNLDELCCGVYDFCKEFLQIIIRTLKTQPEELNATDVLIKLYKHNPKIEHLRGIYHRYTLNYINALTYLDTLRRQVEFVEFEKWSSRDVRCKKLQLTDLLVAPVQHIMRVPIILKDIESHTEDLEDKKEIRAILAVEEASLRELDDKMRWLKNFERLLEIQKNIIWPSVIDLEPKMFMPEFLRDVLSKQPCEKLIVSPRRQIVHEGTLSNFDAGKACDMHVILFDDMLLFTRRKKGLTKRTSTVCKGNSGNSTSKDDGSFKYIVYKHPLSLDRIYVHDVPATDSQAMGLKYVILIVVLNRFQQITTLHWFSAPNEDIKQTWQYKMKKTMDRWKKLGHHNEDGRRSETMRNHELTLEEQIQQSMAAEASQVPAELLHNWIDRRNRNSRPYPRPQSISRPLPSSDYSCHSNINNNTNTPSTMTTTIHHNINHQHKHLDDNHNHNYYSHNRRLSTDDSQIGLVTGNHHHRRYQQSPTRNSHNSELNLVDLRSAPNSPERNQSQPNSREGISDSVHVARGDMSIIRQRHHMAGQQLYPQTSSEKVQSSQSTNMGHSIELIVTNASVNSQENLDYYPSQKSNIISSNET